MPGIQGPFNTNLAFGPDGDLFVVSGDINEVLRYDGTTGDFISTFASTMGWTSDIIFGPDHNLFINNYLNSSVSRHDGKSGDFIDIFVSPGSGGLYRPHRMTFSPSSDLLEYKLKGKCKGGQWSLDVSVDSEYRGSFNCEKEDKIDETITLPAGSGVVVLSAEGPRTRECSSSFSYEQDLDKVKLECKDGSKDDKVEAKFEIKRHGHGPGHDH